MTAREQWRPLLLSARADQFHERQEEVRHLWGVGDVRVVAGARDHRVVTIGATPLQPGSDARTRRPVFRPSPRKNGNAIWPGSIRLFVSLTSSANRDQSLQLARICHLAGELIERIRFDVGIEPEPIADRYPSHQGQRYHRSHGLQSGPKRGARHIPPIGHLCERTSDGHTHAPRLVPRRPGLAPAGPEVSLGHTRGPSCCPLPRSRPRRQSKNRTTGRPTSRRRDRVGCPTASC
jgi:hypothetical protein